MKVMTLKRIVYSGIGILLLVFFILIIFNRPESRKIKETSSEFFPAPTQKIQSIVPQPSKPPADSVSAPSFSSLFEESLLKPVFLAPIKDIKEFIQPAKKEVFSLPAEPPPLTKTTFVGEVGAKQEKPAGSATLTPEQEKEIFAKLYPDYFTNALFDIQNVFIEFGYLGSNYKKIEKFDTEEKIFSFMNAATDVFEKQGWYTKEEAEKFRRGTNEVWKNLMEQEKLDLQKKLIRSDFYKNIFARRINYFKHAINRKALSLFGQLLKNKFVLKAYADSVGDSPGSCWESGPQKPGGANVKALCCDCGIKCGSKTCWYVHHCGPDGEQCDIQLGCLNKIAGTGDNPAIWDPETGICGVG